VEPAGEPTRSFEQMIEEGAGGLSGQQCVALLKLIVLLPSMEIGWAAEAWAARIGSSPELVNSALRELAAPGQRPLELVGDADWPPG
jgi:hypothetical protein